MTGNQLAGMETENRGGNLTCLCEAGKATLTPVNKNVIHCKKKKINSVLSKTLLVQVTARFLRFIHSQGCT